MADKKISALTAATTPLAGTEVLPIVQSGSTVKVSAANITAGRAVDAASIATTGNAAFGAAINANNRLLVQKTDNTAYTSGARGNGWQQVYNTSTTSGTYSGIEIGVDGVGNASLASIAAIDAGSGTTEFAISTRVSNTFADSLYIDSSRNIKAVSGNVVVGTAAKGINFTANTPAAGMTSQLLNWYEEGTWTPSLGGNTTYTQRVGRYVRVGKTMTVMCIVHVNVLGTGSTYQISGLPYYSLSTVFGGVAVGYFENLATNVVSLNPYLSQNDNYINVVGMTAAANTAAANNIFGNSTRLELSATYIIN